MTKGEEGRAHRNGLDCWLRGDKALAVPGSVAPVIRERREAAVVVAGESEAAAASRGGRRRTYFIVREKPVTSVRIVRARAGS